MRCRRDPGSDAPSLPLVEVKLRLALPHPATVILLSLAMAMALPHCGVLTTVGYLSLRSRDRVPNDGCLWDPEQLQAVPVNKLARAVARARFNETPQFPPRPQSPDMRSRHSEDSCETNDPNRRSGLADHPVNARFSPERVPAPRNAHTHRVAHGTHVVATNGLTMAMRLYSTRPRLLSLPHLLKCEDFLRFQNGLLSQTTARSRRRRSSTI